MRDESLGIKLESCLSVYSRRWLEEITARNRRAWCATLSYRFHASIPLGGLGQMYSKVPTEERFAACTHRKKGNDIAPKDISCDGHVTLFLLLLCVWNEGSLKPHLAKLLSATFPQVVNARHKRDEMTSPKYA